MWKQKLNTNQFQLLHVHNTFVIKLTHHKLKNFVLTPSSSLGHYRNKQQIVQIICF